MRVRFIYLFLRFESFPIKQPFLLNKLTYSEHFIGVSVVFYLFHQVESLRETAQQHCLLLVGKPGNSKPSTLTELVVLAHLKGTAPLSDFHSF